MLKIEGVNRVLAAGSGAMKTGEAGEFGCSRAHPTNSPPPETGSEEPNDFHINQNDRRNR